MSDMIIDEINSFTSYKYEPITKRVINLKGISNANLDEFLAIAYLLDSNHIKYKFTSNIDIRILGRR